MIQTQITEDIVKLESRLELLTKIINACTTHEHLETVKIWVDRTTFWTNDKKLLMTAYKLIEAADIHENFERIKINPEEFYECQKFIDIIRIKKGFIPEDPLVNSNLKKPI